MVFLSLTPSFPPVIGRVAAFLVGTILLHAFMLNKSLLRANLVRMTRSSVSPVKVVVLSESLCIDCKHFFDQQLFPVYETLGASVMDLSVIPFGNAKYVPSDDDDPNKQILQCQHGQAECDANSYQQCVDLELYPFPQRYLPFLQCLYDTLEMGHRDQVFDKSVFAGCATHAALDWEGIAKCHDDADKAAALQQRAYALTPQYHTQVPWVEINGSPVEMKGSTSLLKAVCKSYTSSGGYHPACPIGLRLHFW